MTNLKFGLTNLLVQPGALLKNGTGGAPALIETAPYVMANLLVDDRYTLWKSSSLPASVANVDFDLGSAQSINAAGVMGFRPVVNSGPTIDIFYQTGAYNPAGSWTFIDTMVGLQFNLRDTGIEFGSIPNARSFRFAITPSVGGTIFTIGKFFVGSLSDLGAKHSPGATYTPMGNRLETPLVGGAVVLTELGDEGAEFRIPWQVASATVANIFLTLQIQRGSRFMLWPDGHFYEVYLKGRQLTATIGYQTDYELVLGRMP